MDYTDVESTGLANGDDLIIEDDDKVEDDEDTDDEVETETKAKMTASDVRRKIEDYLEKRHYIDELGEEYSDLGDLDWVSE